MVVLHFLRTISQPNNNKPELHPCLPPSNIKRDASANFQWANDHPGRQAENKCTKQRRVEPLPAAISSAPQT